MRLYIDGVLNADLTGVGVPAAIHSEFGTPFNIGRLHDSTVHSFTGGIDDVQLYSVALTAEQIAFLFNNPGLSVDFGGLSSGDFNGDGSVDAADYVLWRKNPGGIYTPDDFNVWRSHFGETVGNGAGANVSATVPEPASAWLLLLGVLAMCRHVQKECENATAGTVRLGHVGLGADRKWSTHRRSYHDRLSLLGLDHSALVSVRHTKAHRLPCAARLGGRVLSA
jgi:hypothetical protein